jgi:hypothetical protein
MKMRATNKIISAIILVLTSLSCTERINIGLDEGMVRLVVEGSVTTDTMAHRVVLTKTTSYYYSESAPAVTGASVSISDGSQRVDLSEVEPGVYETDPSFSGVEGQSYDLQITLASPVGGHSEYSATAKMNKKVTLDSLKLVYQPDWSAEGFYEARCFFKDPPTADYYRILVYRNGMMISDTLDEWFVTDDRFFNGAYVEGASVAFFDQGSERERLHAGDEITIELDCIDKAYADFLWGAQSETWGSNPLFSGPPANVKGNINNGAIGFFGAYTTSRSGVKVEAR